MPFTTSTLNKLLDATHGKASYTAPATVYVGLSTTTPTAAGGNVTEPSGGAYARVAMPAASWGSASNGTITNTAAINFPTATAAWGTVVSVVVFDAASGGNLLWFASQPSQVVPSGATYSFAVGQATSQLS